MGTTYSIKSDVYTDKAVIEKRLLQLNKIFSNWDKNSELSKINRATTKQWITPSKELLFLIKKSAAIHQQTSGFFDIGIGRLIDIWGFGAYKVESMPNQKTIQQELAKSSIKYLKIKDNRIKKLKDIYLNLSAIAKGFAVDEIAKILLQKNSQEFIVEIGGELRVLGEKKIGIERVGQQPISITIKDQAIATSGDYRNYKLYNNVKYIHILNPKTGMPSNVSLISVSVIDDNTYQADAYATALLAMGKSKAIKFIKKYNIKAILIDRKNKIYKFID